MGDAGAPIDVRVSRVFTGGPGSGHPLFAFEAMRTEAEVRRVHPEVPALLMTGYVTDDALWTRTEASGVPVMKKPLRHRELLDRIAELFADPEG